MARSCRRSAIRAHVRPFPIQLSGRTASLHAVTQQIHMRQGTGSPSVPWLSRCTTQSVMLCASCMIRSRLTKPELGKSLNSQRWRTSRELPVLYRRRRNDRGPEEPTSSYTWIVRCRRKGRSMQLYAVKYPKGWLWLPHPLSCPRSSTS